MPPPGGFGPRAPRLPGEVEGIVVRREGEGFIAREIIPAGGEGAPIMGADVIPSGVADLVALGERMPEGIGQPGGMVVPPQFRMGNAAQTMAGGPVIAGSITPDISGRAFTIGRAPGNDLQVPSDGVSRRHAMIYSSGGGWYVVDGEMSPSGNIASSLNGVLVNGQRIQQWTQIHEGDQIGIRQSNDPNVGVILYTFHEPGMQSGSDALACYQSQEANLAVAASVAEEARASLINAASGEAIRYSPSPSAMAAQRAVWANLAFDTNTGEPVRASGTSPANVLQVRIGADMDSQRVFFDDQTRSGLRQLSEQPNISPTVRGIVRGLLSLDNTSLVSAGPAAVAALPAGEGGVEIMPSIAPTQVARMRAAIVPAARGTGAGTIMMAGPMSLLLNPPVVIGLVHIDGNGNVVGATFRRPDGMSPRGTLYSSGVRGGTAIPVVATSDGTIIHMEPPAGLNARQTASLMALENSPQNSASREAFLRDHPYAVDMVMNEGVGRLVNDIDTTISSFRDRRVPNGASYRGSLALLHDGAGGYRFVPADHLSPQDGTPVAVVEVSLRKENEPRAAMAPMTFNYRVTQGGVPAEVTGVLEFVRGRVGAGIAGLMHRR